LLELLQQESPAIADKPAWRESLPKLLQFDVLTTLSLTILAYVHAFNCYWVRNPRNPEKFTENSNLWSSRSSILVSIESPYRRCRRKTSYVDILMILGFLHKAMPLRIFFTVEKSPGHFLRENPKLC